MITASEEFFLEREQINELANLIQRSDLKQHEIEAMDLNLTEEQYKLLKRELTDREIKDLERIRRGETCSAKQINEAVKQACNE